MRSALYLFVSLLAVTVAHGEELRCDISKKYVCESDGCKSVPAAVWNLVDSVSGSYSRCDSRGCDRLQAQLSQSGVFINIDVPGHGLIAKMTADASSFHEIATLEHIIYISFGSCRRN